MDTQADQPLVVRRKMKMNVVFELAKLEEVSSAPTSWAPTQVSLVYVGSEDTIAVSGMGSEVCQRAAAQGRDVVEMVDMIRVNSKLIIKPATGKVFIYVGFFCEGDQAPEPWEVAVKTPIIVEMNKNLAKDQDLVSFFKIQHIAEVLRGRDLIDGHNLSIHMVDKFRVSTFQQETWNDLRSTTAFLVKL